ncbi:hypothetical protein ACFL67_00020 [candidate division KSB1 bacterium]
MSVKTTNNVYSQISISNLTLRITGVLFLLLLLNFQSNVQSQAKEVEISGQWYLSFVAGENDGEDVNKFYAHRGYLNFKPKFSPTLSARITPDITIDNAGDVKMRLKYLYMNFNLPEHTFFKKSYIEFGLVHRPWLDFEEHINMYRMQGTMYLERNHLFNSADFGVTFVTLFGELVDETYQKEVNNKYPGRYGSMAIGIYNGGGYHALEKNTSKVLETRVTFRPSPDKFPGLQASYFGAFGKGNTEDEPDYILNTAYLSYEHQRFIVAGTAYFGEGNSKGNAIDAFGDPYPQSGYSAFAEYKIPNSKFSIVGRYDTFDHDTDVEDNNVIRTIVGLAYHFYGKHKALLDYDYAKDDATGEKVNSLVKFTVEVHF